MTTEELQNLTPEEKRTKIAEACGTMHWSYALPQKTIAYDVPDYLNSLDAMHEAQKTLSDEQCDRYLDFLTETSGGDAEKGKSSFCGYVATAAQCADAFLLTIQPQQPTP